MTTLTTRLVSFLRVMCLVGMRFPFNAFTAKYCLEIFAFPGDYGEMPFELVTNDSTGRATLRVVSGLAKRWTFSGDWLRPRGL